MKYILIVLSLFIAYKIFVPQKIRIFKLTPTASKSNESLKEPCFRKNRCLVAYMAPWCPNCHGAIPIMKQMIEENKTNPSFGVMAVIGMDEGSKNETYAAQIGNGSFVDNNGEIQGAFSINSVPTFVLIDDLGKVISRFSGLPQPPSAEAIRQHLKMK